MTRTPALLAVGLVAALVFPYVVNNQYILLVACIVLLYGAGGMAWNILGGHAGQLSLGHGIYFGIGAYASSILFLTFGVSPWLGMWAGAGLGALTAAGIGYMCFRLRGPYYVLATIGLLVVFETLAMKLKGLTGGAQGLSVSNPHGNWLNFQFSNYEPMYYIGLLLVVVLVIFTHRMDRNRFGHYLRAIREDEDAAEAIGVNTTGYKVRAAAWSGFFTALAGTYYAQLSGFIEPNLVFGFDVSLQFMLVSFIGGASNVWGPIVGSLLLTPLSELLRNQYSDIQGLHLFVYGVAIIVVMLWLREGLVPAALRLGRRLTRKRPQAEKIHGAS
jgi:branched-chain amino acid transport system permease protein